MSDLALTIIVFFGFIGIIVCIAGLMGTIGYQAGILATGFLLARSLKGLYPAIGVMLRRSS